MEKAKFVTSKLGVLLIDLDHFKYINDNWGHERGDFILREAAQRIKSSICPNDLVARLGGDEFSVLIKEASSEKIEQVAKRIVANFQMPLDFGEQQYMPSCSIGISVFPDNGESADEFLNNANTALNSVKEKGHKGFAFFHIEMQERSLEQTLLVKELEKAILQEQFQLEYQPKINLFENKLIGMEALVRWNHPELGMISPGKFIPLAEETGLILPLGEAVLRSGCRQHKNWQDLGYPPIRMSVNMSARQIASPNIVTRIKEILMETGLDPVWLEIEVTESIFVDIDNASTVLQQIRDIGIHISIDDFGTGYSSFSYIKHIPVDVLKIDASFVRDIHQNEQSKAIIRAILTMAQTLGIKVIAEGIENCEQLEALKNEGCSQGQGFLFSKPLSIIDFEDYLKDFGRKIE
ncbi:putative bifunctional diguanylate cyclase/phosphodiesterase [Sporosarcina sp. FSL K6-5500]|uniref:putative bifunctional diguanylate cyclase/phosphodiesterase n=1 Tax=Sporosarcina sp. FSL K6-5500 TaxID=2921558 RepID=UPI0030F97EDF